MTHTLRTFIKGSLFLIILCGPFVSGGVPSLVFFPLLVVTSAIAVYGFYSRSRWATNTTVVMLAVALGIGACDVGLRFTNFVPDDLVERWPRMPLVNRYLPNIRFEGHRFSALARMVGNKKWIENKYIRLVTDANGFRNENVDPSLPLDVIILGDSFGAGAVSHEDTWSSILLRERGLKAYNLSAPAVGPWHEYVNLVAERDRLKTKRGTSLIWQMFTGNDLDDYYGSLELSELPWNGPLKQLWTRIEASRARSPLRNLLQRHSQSADVLPFDFINGRKLLFYRPYTSTLSRSQDQVIQHPNYPHLRATIHAVKTLADREGLRLSIVLVPTKEEVYAWVWRGGPSWSSQLEASSFSVVLERICLEENIPYLDLKPSLVLQSRPAFETSGDLLYWYDDTHLNAVGNRLSAAVIYDKLMNHR